MSIINRHNYEEFFILYMDNELGASERRMVEEFVKLHPDLKEELDMLLQSKLEPDQHITFENKEELIFADNTTINHSNYDEWLVLYLDNELDADKRLAVEQFAASHPDIQKELAIYSATKLSPEKIVFVDKASLYRREEKARPVYWWRMAAAAVLLGAALTTFIIVNNNKIEPVELATNDNQVKPAETPVKTETPVSTQATGAGDASTSIASTSTTDTKIRKTEAAKVKQQNTTINDQNVSKIQEEAAMKSMAKGNVNNLPTPDQNPNVDAYAELKGNTAIQQNTPDKNDLTTSPVKAVNTPVTNPVSYASLQSKNSDASDDAEEFETDGKKNKLRGFFRKVTRTFEKRTNINATDDDDRLLVGGLAIRLK